ncbi:MAG: hypothetical protein ACK4JE_03955 [Endomicrobiia bacterium]
MARDCKSRICKNTNKKFGIFKNNTAEENTGWQEVTIPISSFGLNLTSVRLPFLITAEYITSQLTFDWDYVRWIQ